ncbi:MULTISPECIES: S8 family peptidase [Bacillus]|uniref:S8 family peptidase n=1 Tax=Bacillus TaxID=1386 RepID=UPI000205988C|nr:S8 family serine peptidase [Bacillus amyloliquefaciens]AIW32808.1 serine protease [Bacillus subtilis]AEB22921.1 subtilisin-type proteinase [Bacillus amyloliquefaciens TA208]AEB62373.1 subtilisin-type proteinase [Bacillus amyloliquefaciens LL3]AEK87921.1 intracellular serine protease [Bacillus amyloliquefaciens XH7]MCM3250039.1 S8 family serine peptidase [Bacillus amyloliquefaciens]
MKNLRRISIVFIFVIVSSLQPVSSRAEESNHDESIIINLDSKISESTINKVQEKYSNIETNYIKELDLLVINNIKPSQFSAIKDIAKEKLDANEIIEDKEISLPEKSKQIPAKVASSSQFTEDNDTLYDSWLWNIKQVTNDYRSYQINKGSHNTKVGIIDSGIDFNHPDLKKNIVDTGESFVPVEDNTQDFYGHGTSVAGIIAANGDVKGVGPNLGLVPYKVFDKDGKSKRSWVISAIVKATEDDMDVINLSLSTFLSKKDKDDRETIKLFEKAFKFARKHNTLIVAAAGNHGYDISNSKKLAQQLGKPKDNILHLPGGDNDVITVSATTAQNTKASYSNYGKNISIAAPGGDLDTNKIDLYSLVWTTSPVNIPQTPLSKSLGFQKGYEPTLGTSVAAPIVTATAALLKTEYYEKYGEEMPNRKVEENLYQNTDHVENLDKNEVGSGIVNAYESLLNIER